METLIFAQKFPFTEKARNYLKESGLAIEDVSEGEIKRAALMISKAFSNETYILDVVNKNDEIYKKEIIAFVVAKLLISAMTTQNIIEKFSNFIRKKSFEEIVNEDHSKELCFELADELKIKYDFDENNKISVPLLSYLKIYFIDEETKLINKNVANGRVYLNENDFARFLSEIAYAKVFDSLPIKKEMIPKNLVKIAKSLSSQLVTMGQKKFDKRVLGKMDPELFPPSMKRLYERGLGGEKLTYYERLAIGGFLQQVGMKKEDMLVFFSKSPDYKKHIATYHVNRIYETELSAPGYVKMDEFGIKIDKDEKKFKHPYAYYMVELRIKNRKKNKAKEEKEGKKNV